MKKTFQNLKFSNTLQHILIGIKYCVLHVHANC